MQKTANTGTHASGSPQQAGRRTGEEKKIKKHVFLCVLPCSFVLQAEIGKVVIGGACFSTALRPASPLHGGSSHTTIMAQVLKRRVLAANTKSGFGAILC